MPLYGTAPRVLADAMTAHPEMVSGERRTDLELARAGRGDWIAKIGAEGVQAIGLRGAGVGIAIKVADGNKRVLRPIVASVLEQLGLMDADRRAALAEWFEPVVRNYRGIATGRLESTFVLDKNSVPSPSVAARREWPHRGGELPVRIAVFWCTRAPHGHSAKPGWRLREFRA